MLRRGKAGKRAWIVAGLATAMALLAAGFAFGAAPIVGNADNTFSAPIYTIDQGEVAQLQVLGSTHNVTAKPNGPDGEPVFRSATISGGQTPVDGTQYLTAGDYSFFCSVHPSTMQATLRVTNAGTPVARPHVDMKIKSRKLSKVAKGGVLVAVTASAKVDGASFEARLGPNRILGRVNDVSMAAGPQFVQVPLTKNGKKQLRSRDKAQIAVDATIPFGEPVTAKAKLS
jgi:plastocyanin